MFQSQYWHSSCWTCVYIRLVQPTLVAFRRTSCVNAASLNTGVRMKHRDETDGRSGKTTLITRLQGSGHGQEAAVSQRSWWLCVVIPTVESSK